ncbi:Lrp/AsnC family transcriptional regulator [Nocardia sp. NPDC005998]|uniref:Lrp/AsnC family transcriptional regulator n=1 Tax=Nocardia sp. NPDC005998 TaxID=3156894 RepID=UPI0033A05FB4
MKDISMLDDVDRGLIHALHIDGRAPFNKIAAALHVSTQTVTRRYQRLRATAGLRVVGLADPSHAGHTQWLVRLTTTTTTGQGLAHALARRPDTSWVKITSGGTEILLVVHIPRDAAASRSLLLRDLPRAAGITAVSAHYVLHTYLGGPTAWRGHTAALAEHQRNQLRPNRSDPAPGRALADTDAALLAALQQDGRATLARLAAATGWSQATVTRRLAELQATQAIFFDVEFDDAHFGATTQALLWMSVAPAHLDRVATALADHDELAFVAATTGPTNLVAQAMCADPEALHHYLTHRLGALEAIHALETTPVLVTVKAAGRLPHPDAAGRRP